ncbi:protein HYPER-SENSITIVITY-RELATED 4-like [Solanum tuberosum]|uniref:protein HYPER-SENSITIVITY-RELATED 4-like n=1 Tax=Solanum tuberosum TaxID=4113 RepID=UPI00073A44D3|nr:PREDICTED: protein HYPER-SENSITIVITY-RELATED 4-like [Solanum tuberosum]
MELEELQLPSGMVEPFNRKHPKLLNMQGNLDQSGRHSPVLVVSESLPRNWRKSGYGTNGEETRLNPTQGFTQRIIQSASCNSVLESHQLRDSGQKQHMGCKRKTAGRLTFHKKKKDLVLNSYLPYIMEEAILQKHKNKMIKIHTVGHEEMYNLHDMWKPVNFDHPTTFETIPMESDQKHMILKDLERFMTRKKYYRKVGKAWKRGYLLFGPLGTGKSSLIAAMANYLTFDIYDLELTALMRNSDLRKLLVATINESILVIEDIDCTINLQANLLNRAIYVSSDDFHQTESTVN